METPIQIEKSKFSELVSQRNLYARTIFNPDDQSTRTYPKSKAEFEALLIDAKGAQFEGYPEVSYTFVKEKTTSTKNNTAPKTTTKEKDSKKNPPKK